MKSSGVRSLISELYSASMLRLRAGDENPMLPGVRRRWMIFSMPTKAPQRMNSTLVVSI